jgi:hypothetical protein
MCQLFQACRLCFNMIGIRFSRVVLRLTESRFARPQRSSRERLSPDFPVGHRND